ncbi:phage terminase small subunit P27 family [Chelatococcus sambhunathii]|uniref:Phage terminase small subunit P27 family n=1 Tax=Chelatococcus sambhunathii TaxID=363953 RepID=A0ABU1DEN7_9HYPH|nr:phage terminase small subunit P27 family [Chelatococcus sambhunathii]MDR4306564.1 phage terminase small subunit P27 family [Chelatococcus sambhunathii]
MRGRKPAAIVSGSATVAATPRAPTWLSPDAKAEWKRVAPILAERGTLTEADLGTLESYVTATGIVREAQRAITRDGLITATPDGPKRHPAFGIMNAAMTTARLCAAELGLTPVSRSRPSIREDHADDDADLGL